MQNFTVVDVETANHDRTSICQIGIVHVNNGVITDEWKLYVNPLQKFSWWHTQKCHGITEEMVAGSPTINDIQNKLQQQLNGKIVISHGTFDRNAFKYIPLNVKWLNSIDIIRRAYPQIESYSLGNLANEFGIIFKAHDALEDAKATATILLQILDGTKTSIDYWV